MNVVRDLADDDDVVDESSGDESTQQTHPRFSSFEWRHFVPVTHASIRAKHTFFDLAPMTFFFISKMK